MVVGVHGVGRRFRRLRGVPRDFEPQRRAPALDALAQRVHARGAEPELLRERRVVRAAGAPRHVRLLGGRLGVLAFGHVRAVAPRDVRDAAAQLPARHHRGLPPGERRAERPDEWVRVHVLVRAQRRRRLRDLRGREGEDQPARGVVGGDERSRRRHRERHGGGLQQRVRRQRLGCLRTLLHRVGDWERHGLELEERRLRGIRVVVFAVLAFRSLVASLARRLARPDAQRAGGERREVQHAPRERRLAEHDGQNRWLVGERVHERRAGRALERPLEIERVRPVLVRLDRRLGTLDRLGLAGERDPHDRGLRRGRRRRVLLALGRLGSLGPGDQGRHSLRWWMRGAAARRDSGHGVPVSVGVSCVRRGDSKARAARGRERLRR